MKQDAVSRPSTVKKTQLAKKSHKTSSPAPSRGWLLSLGAIAALMTGGVIIAGGIWLSILWMIDPNSVVWLNRFLPEWTRIPVNEASPPKTLATIQGEIRQAGFIPAEELSLNSETDTHPPSILIPLLKSEPHCQTDCQKVVELRVYQPAEAKGIEVTYRLVNQLPIKEPEEYFVLSSLSGNQGTTQDGYHAVPLTKIIPFNDKAPDKGLWFNLSGERFSDGTNLYYGQVIHYNPDQNHLSVMVEWTSPNELQPYWQQVTGSTTSELVVNQTVGLEPKFKVYQIQPRKFVPNPIYLEEISFTTPAVNTPSYRNGLILAQNGLWSLAAQLLQTEKKSNLSGAALAQFEVIKLHAQFTKSQAEQNWATPSQGILTNLIDGRFPEALQLFQTSINDPIALQEIVSMLKTDTGGLWQRVNAALDINRNCGLEGVCDRAQKETTLDTNIKSWGALIIGAKQGKAKAIAWLKKLAPTESETTPSPSDIQIYALLDYLEGGISPPSPINSHLSQIIGTAQKITTVKPDDWLQPGDLNLSVGIEESGRETETKEDKSKKQTSNNKKTLTKNKPPEKDANQIWYQIQVAAFHDGQKWQQTPFLNLTIPSISPGKRLWQYLGLDTSSEIQIAVWTSEGNQETTIATIKAVSYRGGVIQLLAAGYPLPVTKTSRPLAYSETAMRPLEGGSITLSDLNQLQPQWVAKILPVLSQELIKSGKRSPNANSSVAGMLEDMGYWSIQPVDLTGNNQPEAVLTLYEDISGKLKKLDEPQPLKDNPQYKPRTMIFSDTGSLVYSEFSQDSQNSLTAIADLSDGGTPALILNSETSYKVKRWVESSKRFE
ncbi:MAG TPA: hypothetical protein DEG17_02335 [Cyanobacteria bacterium UBA11149]|nr:hypothetical protein [Cyanobacteria bacterium UBA11367]HBE57986.1 hypothetical protein [Cyanobacteria bacterium UBA11366]HBK66039.1 hypothetical protein [Cyanobacteria bacterium UBA11166]HBR74003.1 hypothetical protein [Cyanobacteria bacterium UBA11159]HBS69827.1 hypothetical protein [Cyanobacteria bacterium UBA11153]HBW87744.1 hypothetical protein [Cyanobacteria bacterium UBA11149]HCA96251.1 hypothetical protein [Cyanobacteria bacterium UBA9226]